MPGEYPVTTPELEPTAAKAGVLLVQVPVPEASPKDNVAPVHTMPVPSPVIAAGAALTVTVAVELEVHPNELVTVSVGVNVPVAE